MTEFRKNTLFFLPGLLLVLNIAIGYWVAFVLFSMLASDVAGQIMGVFLQTLYWIDLVSVVMLILLSWKCRQFFRLGRWELWSGLLLVALNLFYVSPIMKTLKSSAAQSEILAFSFSQWHGISQGIFLLFLGFLLVWFVRLARVEIGQVKP